MTIKKVSEVLNTYEVATTENVKVGDLALRIVHGDMSFDEITDVKEGDSIGGPLYRTRNGLGQSYLDKALVILTQDGKVLIGQDLYYRSLEP